MVLMTLPKFAIGSRFGGSIFSTVTLGICANLRIELS